MTADRRRYVVVARPDLDPIIELPGSVTPFVDAADRGTRGVCWVLTVPPALAAVTLTGCGDAGLLAVAFQRRSSADGLQRLLGRGLGTGLARRIVDATPPG